MMRWLDEFLHPKKACERKGHSMVPVERRVYLYPPEWSFRAVADEAEEHFGRCRRCGLETPPVINNRHSLQGLSMPGDLWDQLQRDGRLVL